MANDFYPFGILLAPFSRESKKEIIERRRSFIENRQLQMSFAVAIENANTIVHDEIKMA